MSPELERMQSLLGSVGVLWLRCEICRAGDNCHPLVVAGKIPPFAEICFQYIYDQGQSPRSALSS